MDEKNFSKYILIIDDSEMIRYISKEVLETKGYNVETASTAEEALLKINNGERVFDLLIVDINLPKKNGFTFMEIIKTLPKYENVPIMILSADTKASSVLRAIQMGAADYIGKPFDTTEFIKRVEKLIGIPPEKGSFVELKKILKNEINRAKRGNLTLSLIIAQSEKKLNPEILKVIIEKIRENIRDIDTVIDINGSTIALILPLTGLEGAKVVVNKILALMRGKWHFGIATYPANGKDEKELFDFAKQNLIQEITNSKNKTAESKEKKDED